MRRLLTSFDEVFDLDFEVDGARLGDLIERALSGIEREPLVQWGVPGPRNELRSSSDRLVSFYYRPHLFPGMSEQLRLAHELQFHLLPRGVPPAAPLSVATVLESYCHLSGDLFGWEPLPDDRFLIWIVDMSGHGVRAGLTSAVLKLLVGRARDRSRVDQLLGFLNRTLSRCVREPHRGIFATAFFMAISPDGSATYGSAGHPPMLLRRRAGAIEELGSLDLPVGMFEETEFRSRALQLAPGDTLFLFSDGLLEAEGHDGEMFGLARARRLVSSPVEDPAALTSAVYAEVTARQDIDRLDDDLTFLAARFDGDLVAGA